MPVGRTGRFASLLPPTLALSIALSSCGYTFAAAPGLVSLTHGAPVSISPFQNESFEANAGLVAAQTAGRALAERGGTITAAGGSYELRGTVLKMSAVPTGIGWWHVVGQVRLELVDVASGGRVVAHSLVSDGEDYRSSTDAEGTEASRRIATERLLQKLTAAAIDRLAP